VKVTRQIQRESNQHQAEAARKLGEDYKEFFRLVHLQHRAPDGLQSPGEREQADDESIHRIADAHLLKEEERHDVDGIKWKALGKIDCRHPGCGIPARGLRIIRAAADHIDPFSNAARNYAKLEPNQPAAKLETDAISDGSRFVS
jgi:hypothetical protein